MGRWSVDMQHPEKSLAGSGEKYWGLEEEGSECCRKFEKEYNNKKA